MSTINNNEIDPVKRFHRYLTKPEITRDDLEALLLIAQELRELEFHYRDNRKYIEGFLHDMLEQLRSSDDDAANTAVCSPEFVESLKFVER